ncbi:ORF6N domain-containing protein [Candidatus Saccharibacteria bacterium]|nr:ORF6N domain-containing protein [Candidatus Saccharibacteria bacterium]
MGYTDIDFVKFKNKIYEIRGQKVMLDFDLADIYGYTTKAFNQQVARNLEKFDEDFRFQVTTEELRDIGLLTTAMRTANSTNTPSSRSHFVTLNVARGSNFKYLPYAFTESGIYMLMTVLRGKLAIQQSKALIRTFRTMKEYVVRSHETIEDRNTLRTIIDAVRSRHDIGEIRKDISYLDKRVEAMSNGMSEYVKKTEIASILFDFTKMEEQHGFLILNGQPAKASEIYIDIYHRAKNSVVMIDDYVNIKTLRLLQGVKPGIPVRIISNNKGNYLHRSDLDDFRREFPKIKIEILKNEQRIHDRFIIIDHGTDNEKLYMCGSSAKDSGSRLTVITEIEDDKLKRTIINTVLKED